MSGSWKVAYADFVTAMMAFFLLMWILNMAPKETMQGLAGYFAPDASLESSVISPVSDPSSNVVRVTNLDTRQMEDVEKSQYAIARMLQEGLGKAVPSNAGGVGTNRAGVLLHTTGDTLFTPQSVEISPEGHAVLDEVIKVMKKYDVYLVVRGHTSKGETGEPNYPSKWELSAARAAAVVRYLIEKGDIDPTRVRTVAYGDTRPLVPDTDAEASAKNRRVEFYFHRPEVLPPTTGY